VPSCPTLENGFGSTLGSRNVSRGRIVDSVEILPAKLSDLDAITAIYNDAIETTTATFDTEPRTAAEQRQWFEDHSGRYSVLVAHVDGVVVGWASLSRWSGRCAYRDTAETSFYVKSESRGGGIGRALKLALIDEARKQKFHSLIAQIADGSDASRHLTESVGFRYVGTLEQVGQKFGRLLDVHLFQLVLG